MLTGNQGLLSFVFALLPSDFWFGVALVLGSAFLWVLMCLMVGQIPGGWISFAKRHPAQARPDGEVYSVLSCESFNHVSGGKGIRLIFTDAGIYFYMFFLGRPGHPPFLLPWGSVKSVKRKYGFLDDYYRIHVRDAAGKFSVDLPLKVEQDLSRHHKLDPVAETQSREPSAAITIPGGMVKFVGGLLLAGVIYWLSSSLHKDDVMIPGKYGHAAHFHGLAAWFMSGSVFCFAVLVAGFLIMPKYRSYRRKLVYMGWALFFIGIVVGIWNHNK